MSFSLYFLLILYLVFLVVWFIFGFVGVYHMLKYGFKTFTTFFAIAVYIAISVVILLFSFQYLNGIDWQINVLILDSAFNGELPYQ